MLFYSDGLIEAHGPDGQMFGLPRLRELAGRHSGSTPEETVEFLLDQLAQFTGVQWEQEDDITLVTLQRAEQQASGSAPRQESSNEVSATAKEMWETVLRFSLLSEPGNERIAMGRVREALEPLCLPARDLDNLGTAVAEAAMNAMEHGNGYASDVPIEVQVEASADYVRVGVTDWGETGSKPEAAVPDLELKLAGTQAPRGWGLFLIEHLVDELHVVDSENGHILQLFIRRKEGDNDSE